MWFRITVLKVFFWSPGTYYLQKHTTAHKNRSSIPPHCIKLKPSKATDIFRVQIWSTGDLKRFRTVWKISWLKKVQASRNLVGILTIFPLKCFSTVLFQLKVSKNHIKKNPTHFSLSEEFEFPVPQTNPRLFFALQFSPPPASYQLRFCSCSNKSLSVRVQPPRQDGSYQFTSFLLF